VVAPLNTHTSWVEKYAMQAPQVDVTVIDRKDRDAFVDAIRLRKGDVFLCHYEALRLMPGLMRYNYQTMVLDEVHRISNRKAGQTRAAFQVGSQAKHRLAMSGTASGDKPQNLWSILHWLWPKYYSSFWRFEREYIDTYFVADPNDEDGGYRKVIGVKNEARLHAQIEPFYIRHLKKQTCCSHHPNGVMSYLPDKTYGRVWVDLSATQRKFYEQMRKQMIAWVGEHENEPLMAGIAIAQMTRLSQMALATPDVHQEWRNVKDKKTGIVERKLVDVVTLHEPSSKIAAAQELIEDGGKPVVVFTSSKQVAYLAQQAFTRAKITSAVLSSDTPQAVRNTMVADFVHGKYMVFIGVIQAAAEGIDGLQHATDTAIFLDRSWSTIKNQQAEDRLHRGGTKNTVQIIDIMARSTVDLGRHQTLKAKWTWIKQILGDGLNQLEPVEE